MSAFALPDVSDAGSAKAVAAAGFQARSSEPDAGGWDTWSGPGPTWVSVGEPRQHRQGHLTWPTLPTSRTAGARWSPCTRYGIVPAVRPHHLAQLNVGRLRAPREDPMIAEFMDGLDPVNARADAAPGFVWRLQTDEGNATAITPTDDPQWILNMSVWTGLEALRAFVYDDPEHLRFLRRRREWFDKLDNIQVLWWVPAGHLPSIDEALARRDHLIEHGPTAHAFTFRAAFAAPDAPAPAPDPGELCPA